MSQKKRTNVRAGVIPREVVFKWLAAKQRMAEAKMVLRDAREAVIEALGANDAARAGMLGSVTHFEEVRHDLDIETFRAENPDVYDAYTVASKRRKLLHHADGSID